MYAVNLGDLMALKMRDPVAMLCLFPPEIFEPVSTIEAERGRVDAPALVITCPEERVEAIIWVIRRKYGRAQLRFYRSLTGNGGWARV